jgi:hypothetical protein
VLVLRLPAPDGGVIHPPGAPVDMIGRMEPERMVVGG